MDVDVGVYADRILYANRVDCIIRERGRLRGEIMQHHSGDILH